jgi:hypothetical protein
MKKPSIALAFFIIIAVTLISLSIGTIGTINCNESNGYADSHSSDLPHFQGVTKSNGYYNISLAFSNVQDPIRIDNIIITNPNNHEDNINPTIYVNGTIMTTYPLSCLNSGDSLQINLTIPTAKYKPGTTLNLYVMGDCFGCGKTVVLP